MMRNVLAMIGVLFLGIVTGATISYYWVHSDWTLLEKQWKIERDAEVNGAKHVAEQRLGDMALRLARADSALLDILRISRNERAASRSYRDSVIIYREALSSSTTLAECNAVGQRLADSCEAKVMRAEAAWERSDDRAGRIELALSGMQDSVAAVTQREQRLVALLNSAPVNKPRERWMGFLPRPTTVFGVGCSAGFASTAGCGVSVVLGFPIHF